MENIFYIPTKRPTSDSHLTTKPFQKLIGPFYQFGRREIIDWLHFKNNPANILQIGDSSIRAESKLMSKFPEAELVKMDFVEMTINQNAAASPRELSSENTTEQTTQFLSLIHI